MNFMTRLDRARPPAEVVPVRERRGSERMSGEQVLERYSPKSYVYHSRDGKRLANPASALAAGVVYSVRGGNREAEVRLRPHDKRPVVSIQTRPWADENGFI